MMCYDCTCSRCSDKGEHPLCPNTSCFEGLLPRLLGFTLGSTIKVEEGYISQVYYQCLHVSRLLLKLYLEARQAENWSKRG